jgi:two-component sensor histidine kinase
MAVAKIRVDQRLKALLREREVLLQEVHHRVKNNMHSITSLLSIMASSIHDEQARRALQEGENRIRAMATVHQMLYKTDDLTHINFREYATDIVYHLFHSYGISTNQVAPKLDIEDVPLGIDVAIPCGMLLNELVSNSLKYAFPDGKTGRVTVTLHTLGDGYELTVSDTGVGLPEGFQVEQAESLGLKLVAGWARQVQGEYTLGRSEQEGVDGTQFRLVFTRQN